MKGSALDLETTRVVRKRMSRGQKMKRGALVRGGAPPNSHDVLFVSA